MIWRNSTLNMLAFSFKGGKEKKKGKQGESKANVKCKPVILQGKELLRRQRRVERACACYLSIIIAIKDRVIESVCSLLCMGDCVPLPRGHDARIKYCRSEEGRSNCGRSHRCPDSLTPPRKSPMHHRARALANRSRIVLTTCLYRCRVNPHVLLF